MDLSYSNPGCGEGKDERPWILKDVQYLNYAIFLFGLTSLSSISISLLTKPIEEIKVPVRFFNVLLSLRFENFKISQIFQCWERITVSSRAFVAVP